ncbi:MAG: hypothetical protein DMF65_11725 [Acidobacteria bacterium]|nr:MAG: hypothetical protein DMF65_11725 [Acidobacteriota bacterium]
MSLGLKLRVSAIVACMAAAALVPSARAPRVRDSLAAPQRATSTPARAAQSRVADERRVIPDTPPPKLPAAGGTFKDPAFGAEIMRVTDERDGKLNGTFYPHWPTFNADSTRLLVKRYETGDATYSFDPAAFRLGESRPLPRLPDNGVLITEGAIWSTTDPDTLYGATFNGPYLWALNVASGRYTLVKDLKREPGFKASDYLWQMSMSADCDAFAFTHKNASYKTVGYGVYRRSTDSLLLNEVSADVDEVRLDKSGHYLIAYLTHPDAKGYDLYVHDLRAGRVTRLRPTAPDYSLSHGDVGTGFLVGWDNDENRFLRRELSDPHPFVTVLSMGGDWMNQHVSMLARDESWALVSFYSYGGGGGLGPGLFHNELVLVRTDGSGRFRRLLQHRSKANDYWQTPRANLSYDGRFVAFSSNWGGSPRVDLFVAKIDPPLGTSARPSPAQPSRTRPQQRPRRVNSN